MAKHLFLLGFLILWIRGSCVGAQPKTDLPENPKIEKLINQLGSERYKERAEAQEQLRNMPEAIPYLRQSLGTANLERRERINAILAGVKAKKQIDLPKTLERAKDFAKAGKIELAMEQLFAIEPVVHKEIYWQTALDIGNIVKERAVKFYQRDFKRPVLSFPETVSDYLQAFQQPNLQWVSSDASLVEKGQFFGCMRANGARVGSMRGILLSSKETGFNTLAGSIVLTHDLSIQSPWVIGTLVLARDSHLPLNSGLIAHGSIIICRGDLPRVIDIRDSILISSGNISIHKKATRFEGQWIIQENEPKPLQFIEWFETSQIGIDADRIDGSIVISKLDPKYSFAQAGCTVGDKVLAVDNEELDLIESFRIALRRGAVEGKLVLKILRGKKVIEIPVSIKELGSVP
jgi:hypothetical protein